MKRRDFLEASAATLLLAGCGGGSGDDAVVPDTLRVSRTDIIVGDVNGTLYRARPAANTLARIDASGNAIWTIGTRGKGPSQFDFPAALVADSRGRVLVVDRGNSRVQVFDGATGRYLAAFGSAGTGPGQFHIARRIAASADRIYVVDQLNDRINVFDMDGHSLLAIGAAGAGPGALNAPRGVAVDGAGSVYVSDSNDDVIRRYGPDGTYQSSIASVHVDHPRGLAFDGTGQLWVADSASGRVVVLTPQGSLSQSLATRLPDGRPGAPHDIALVGRDAYVRAAVNG